VKVRDPATCHAHARVPLGAMHRLLTTPSNTRSPSGNCSRLRTWAPD
jgi:hypothetical protein